LFKNKKGTSAQGYALIQAMDSRGDVMAAKSRNTRNGIIHKHIYTVLGVKTVTITRAGKTAARQIVIMRNPWAYEEYYGPFSDSDSCWKDSKNNAAKSQLQYTNAKDGRFFMEIGDFLTDFKDLTSSTIIEGHQHSQLESVNDN
jgi:hypothetical protein